MYDQEVSKVIADHSEVFAILRKVVEAGPKEADTPKLISYVCDHCFLEERLMKLTEYPKYLEHSIAHQQLQDEFVGIFKDFLHGDQKAIKAVNNLFISHLEKWDKDFLSYINNHK